MNDKSIGIKSPMDNKMIPYGRGATDIARQVKAETGTNRSLDDLAAEMSTAIDAWKTVTYPTAWSYMSECANSVYDPGYIVNPWGRMRRFSRVNTKERRPDFERQAQNFNIQSTVADTMQLAMDKMISERAVRNLNFRLQNQIHDAIMLEVPENEVDRTRQMFLETMGDIVIPVGGALGSLKLDVDIDVYTRWGEKQK